MSVLFSRTAVRCPPCVPDAVGAVQRFQADHLFQIAQLAFRPANLQMPARAILPSHGDTRRVIAPIFELLQPVNDYGDDPLFTEITYDSVHSKKPCLSPAPAQGTLNWSNPVRMEILINSTLGRLATNAAETPNSSAHEPSAHIPKRAMHDSWSHEAVNGEARDRLR